MTIDDPAPQQTSSTLHLTGNVISVQRRCAPNPGAIKRRIPPRRSMIAPKGRVKTLRANYTILAAGLPAPTLRSELAARVEQDRDRARVDERDVHRRLESPRHDRHAGLA